MQAILIIFTSEVQEIHRGLFFEELGQIDVAVLADDLFWIETAILLLDLFYGVVYALFVVELIFV